MARTGRWPRAPAGRSIAGPGWRRRCRASARMMRTTRTSTRTKRRTELAARGQQCAPGRDLRPAVLLPEELSDLRAQGASDKPPAVLRGGPDEPPVFDTDARPLLFRILCFRLLFFKFGVHFAPSQFAEFAGEVVRPPCRPAGLAQHPGGTVGMADARLCFLTFYYDFVSLKLY